MHNSSLDKIGDIFGINGEKLELIAGGKLSFVYEYPDNDKPLIVRAVTNSDNRYELTCAETEFVEYLAENGINASRPVKSINGNMTELLEIQEGQFVVTLFEKAKGRAVTLDDWNPDTWEAIGKEIGRSHYLTKNYTPTSNYRRPQWYDADIMDIDKYIPEKYSKLRENAHLLIHEIRQLPKVNNCYGLIHSDINRENMFIDNGKIILFDFEDCEYHWLINDIAIPLYFAVEDAPDDIELQDYLRQFMTCLLKGYNSYNQLDAIWFERISLFHKLRDLLTVLYFHAYGGYDLDEAKIVEAELSRENLENNRSFLPFEINSIID